MTIEDSFRARMKEVRSYLRSLQQLEKAYVLPGRNFYRARATIDASRASAFIMIYNCVEYGVREAITSLRSDIEACGKSFDDLSIYWKQEIIEDHFYEPLKQGTQHVAFLRSIAKFLPGSLSWKNGQQKLPFSGNVDHKQLFRYVDLIGYQWKPPKKTLGGTDLILVRETRNDLAHGKETFETVGSQYTTEDLIIKLERVREFVVAFIKMIDRYKQRKLYLKP